tara:strand:- start:1212 stop:1922 length:711 start_codon:yes stop_codon:yes gene_type:complete
MKINFTKISIVLVLFLLTSCAVSVKLPTDYFENGNNKVGIIYTIDTNHIHRTGNQGLLDLMLTPGTKYYDLNERVRNDIDLNDKVKDLYAQIFSKKAKDLILINITEQELNDLPSFKKTSTSTTTYFHKKDLQFLKQKGIDELLIVSVKYGILIDYYGFIELSKNAICTINSEIIDLSNNQIIYKDFSLLTKNLKIKADPSNKEFELDNKMFDGINNIIPETFELEKNKFLKPKNN